MPKRILLIDDDIDDQMILRSAIELVDPALECSFASNGKEAVEYMERDLPFDMILLDLNMPMMNGFETLKTIKKMFGYQEVPVVVISTSSSNNDIERCILMGASRYIIKPETFPALIDELKQLLDQ